jgi:predicted nucleic acid-binding protein
MKKGMKRRLPPATGHKLFVDTSAIVALFDNADPYHEQAAIFKNTFILRYNLQLLTSNYIYSEAMSRLTHVPIEVLQQLDALIRNPLAGAPIKIEQLWVMEDTIAEAVPIYFQYIEQRFSITDCTSFILMKKHGIQAAFTFDDHYKMYTYKKGHSDKVGFWKLPEMQDSYVSG